MLRQVWAIVAKDALIEWRTRDLLATMGGMGLAAVVACNFAVDFARIPFSAAGAPVLWLAFLFTGTIGLSRSFALERENRCLEGILLSPLDRSLLYVGKLVSNLVVLLAFDALLVALAAILLNVGPGAVRLGRERWLVLALAILASTVGFAAVGTLVALMAQRTRRGDFLLPVLQSCLTLPVLIAGVVATQRVLRTDAPMADAWAPLELLAAFDVVLVSTSLVLFEVVVED